MGNVVQIGDIVHYYFTGEPRAGLVTAVHSPTCVDLHVFFPNLQHTILAGNSNRSISGDPEEGYWTER